MITQSRLCAFKILRECAENKAYSNIVLSSYLDKAGLRKEDSALVTEIVYGTVSRLNLLDYYIGKYSSKPCEKLDVGIKIILEMSFYQLLFLRSTPDYAVCNEAVLLAEKFFHKAAGGFVNAVLRAYLRNKDIALPDDTTAYGMSINYSVSKDIAKLLKDTYGTETARKILAESFNLPSVYLSVNTIKTSAEALAKTLDAQVVTEGVIKIKNGNVKSLNGFEEGLFFVQDIASATAVQMLAPAPGDNVIDVCAAPGGKSLKAAVMMQNNGSVRAFDIHKSKLSLIEASAKRLGLTVITAEEGDAAKLNEKLCKTADKVICDVPCSGLGVMAKKPEIRYKQLSEITPLYEIQAKILETAANYLKHGGKILYSTCTINLAENGAQVERFLANHRNFRLEAEKTMMPCAENDGFYMAVLVND